MEKIKISIITPTYNREKLLTRLYNSILKNIEEEQEINVEWIVIDDGSTDNTERLMNDFINKTKEFTIKYIKQENTGKMQAINNVVNLSSGDLIIECDSDDYFVDNSFRIVKETYLKNKEDKKIYAFAYLKLDQKNNNMGNKFKKEKTTMFDLYFKEKENGEKALVFIGDIRRKYRYELEDGEKFITESRMYHKMDLEYKIFCSNLPIQICEYQEKGYSKNILEEFKKYPKGYLKYFEEIFNQNFEKVPLPKRVYVIKHYILFSYLVNKKKMFNISKIKGKINKMMYIMLFVPGRIKCKIQFK